MLRSLGTAAVIAGLALAGCGGGDGSQSSASATTSAGEAAAPTVGQVKQCLLGGGATSVSGNVLTAGEGQHVGIVKATGPEGGRIQMAVYESAAEAKQAIVIFSSSDPKKLFRAVGPVLVVFDQQPAAGDRELAASCAGG
ncbi:MAG: hypothetical protein U0R71_16350 [Solirubrobacterales bacterium]